MTKYDLNTDNLYNRKTAYTNHLHETEYRWFAVYTNFKREKLVCKQLELKGISCYLPLQQHTRKYSRKIRTVDLPLISGYVFVNISKKEYLPVLQTEHILKFVRFSKELIAIPDREIEIIKRVVGEGIPIEVDRKNLVVGDDVEIISGNLTGLKGMLVDSKENKLVEIELAEFGYSLRINVDPILLKRIKSPELIN